MDLRLEHFISQSWGRQMTKTKTVFSSAIIWLAFLTHSGAASEPHDPIPPNGKPYDWECVYPYTETTCAEVIAHWAEDNLDDPLDVSEEVVGCSQCTEIKAKDWNGDRWVVGYRCDNRHGYEVVADDFEVKIPLYREGDSKHGWAVDDWALFPCVRTWECYDGCTWDRGVPVCFVVMVVGIGRFQPVLGEPCDQQGVVDPDTSQQSEEGSGFDPASPFDLDREATPEPDPESMDDSDTGSRWY